MMIESDDCNRRIAAWFTDVISSSGRPQKEIARMLDLSDSAVSRIKAQKQGLSATQMLILHEQLGAPLPSLTRDGPAAKFPSGNTSRGPSNATARSTTALFDIAYDQVCALNDAAPEDRKMSQPEMLETVFHAMKRIALK